MTLRLQHYGATTHLLIDRAAKRNAFDMAMWQAVPGLLEDAAARSECRLLIVRAAQDGAFCAGADIRELLANKDDAAWRAENQRAINHVQYTLARFVLPTIAFVDGDCVGGGCGLALACDMRVATTRARFGITPAKLGLVYPLHDVKLLVDLVGPGQARRILYTGVLIEAEEALRIGLIETIADDPGEFADAILAASPHSVRETKRFVRRVLDGQVVDDAETKQIFAEAFGGGDFAEGTAAFVEKRRPVFGSEFGA
ncbi:MAG: enoyl-CoA hydratase-related protein [Parerythrobacter sp.]